MGVGRASRAMSGVGTPSHRRAVGRPAMGLVRRKTGQCCRRLLRPWVTPGKGWRGDSTAKARSLQPPITPTLCSDRPAGSAEPDTDDVCLQLDVSAAGGQVASVPPPDRKFPRTPEEQMSVPFLDISKAGATSCSQTPSVCWGLWNVRGSSWFPQISPALV